MNVHTLNVQLRVYYRPKMKREEKFVFAITDRQAVKLPYSRNIWREWTTDLPTLSPLYSKFPVPQLVLDTQNCFCS